MRSPLSFLVVENYGGAAGRIANDATAYPHRNLPWDILFGAQWTDPLETSIHRDWARSSEDVLRPYSANAHLSSALDVEAQESYPNRFRRKLASPASDQGEVRSGQLFPRKLQHPAGIGSRHGIGLTQGACQAVALTKRGTLSTGRQNSSLLTK